MTYTRLRGRRAALPAHGAIGHNLLVAYYRVVRNGAAAPSGSLLAKATP